MSLLLSIHESSQRNSLGFTLIELMVVMTIIAILASLSAPSFARLIQSTSISSNVNTFLADMRYARSESIRRGGGVVMCRSDSPEAVNPSCSTGAGENGKGWVSGWIIFHDLNNDATRSSDEMLLRVQAPISSINAITDGNDFATKFRFTATGRFLNLNSATTLVFGASPTFPKDIQRAVCVTLGGSARIAGDGTAVCGSAQP